MGFPGAPKGPGEASPRAARPHRAFNKSKIQAKVSSLTKPYKFIGFGAMYVTKPYKYIGFGAMYVTKPYKFIGFPPLDHDAYNTKSAGHSRFGPACPLIVHYREVCLQGGFC